MTVNNAPPRHKTAARPLPPSGDPGEYISINDNLPTSSPSGKTVLKVLASLVGLAMVAFLYAKTIGF